MKLKFNKKFSPHIFLLLIILVGVVFYLLFTKKGTNVTSSLNEGGISQPSQPEISESPRFDPSPTENAIYFGKADNRPLLFYTNKKTQKYLGENYTKSKKTSPYLGQVLMLDGGTIVGSSPASDFKDLKDPKILYSNNKFDVFTGSFVFNDSKSILYLSIFLTDESDTAYQKGVNKILQINMDNLSYEEIWSHRIESDEYDGAHGGAHFDPVEDNYFTRAVYDDKYLVFWLAKCSECDGGPAGIVILNIETLNDKYIKETGNVIVRVSQNSFTYQKLYPYGDKEYHIVGKPGGDIFTEILP